MRTIAAAAGLKAAVCGKRRPCEVFRVRDAGVDSQGRPLRIVTADLGVARPDPGERPPPRNSPGSIESTDDSDTTDGPESFGQGCHRYEFWVTVGGAPQLLYESCNDGYGAAMVGRDGIQVRDREVTVSRGGGSNWRWESQWRVGLDPVHVKTDVGVASFAGGGGHYEEDHWSWEDFRGTVEWGGPVCDPDGSPPAFDDSTGEEKGDTRRMFYVPIPQVKVEPEFDRGGWRTTHLAGCAAYVDATGVGGYVTFGPPGSADDASIAAVASSDGALFLEIHDDHWTGPSARWVADDHVELWTAAEQRSYMDACLPRDDDAPPKQWAIRAADGRVFPGFGNPSPAALSVERVAADGAVRMRVVLPHDAQAIAVVYSDGDDGARQKRLIATSALKFGDRVTLGALRKVSPDEAVCVAREGALRPQMTRRPAGKALIGPED